MHEARERTGIPVLYCTEYRSVRVRYPVQYRTVPVALLQYRLPVSRVPCVPYGSRLPKVSFYRYARLECQTCGSVA